LCVNRHCRFPSVCAQAVFKIWHWRSVNYWRGLFCIAKASKSVYTEEHFSLWNLHSDKSVSYRYIKYCKHDFNVQMFNEKPIPPLWCHHANLFGKVQQQVMTVMIMQSSCSFPVAMCFSGITFKITLFYFHILAALMWIHTVCLHTSESSRLGYILCYQRWDCEAKSVQCWFIFAFGQEISFNP